MKKLIAMHSQFLFCTAGALALCALIAGTSRGACFVWEQHSCCSIANAPLGVNCFEGELEWSCGTIYVNDPIIGQFVLKDEEGLNAKPPRDGMVDCVFKQAHCGSEPGTCWWSLEAPRECEDFEEPDAVDCDPFPAGGT